MKIIAHRGMWENIQEKNSLNALKRALDAGYGFETDLRDYKGKLVISHNIADQSCAEAEEIFRYYMENKYSEELALNVKSDGIQSLVEELLNKYHIEDYFMFDMSIPEQVVYNDRHILYYTRHSDIENQCVLYQEAMGVWLDSFYNDEWLTQDIIEAHIKDGKRVCIVSAELHGKDYTKMWDMLKRTGLYRSQMITLCTDVPNKAKEFFDYD